LEPKGEAVTGAALKPNGAELVEGGVELKAFPVLLLLLLLFCPNKPPKTEDEEGVEPFEVSIMLSSFEALLVELKLVGKRLDVELVLAWLELELNAPGLLFDPKLKGEAAELSFFWMLKTEAVEEAEVCVSVLLFDAKPKGEAIELSFSVFVLVTKVGKLTAVGILSLGLVSNVGNVTLEEVFVCVLVPNTKVLALGVEVDLGGEASGVV